MLGNVFIYYPRVWTMFKLIKSPVAKTPPPRHHLSIANTETELVRGYKAVLKHLYDIYHSLFLLCNACFSFNLKVFRNTSYKVEK